MITLPYFNPYTLADSLNMNNDKLKQVRLLEFDNSKPFRGKRLNGAS
jgi:hypothetical protein